MSMLKPFFYVAFSGEDFKKIQEEVADILRGRILVGHAVHNDLKVHISIVVALKVKLQ